jgi:hypothetical protein
MIYGRLKGLNRGHELKTNVEALMIATSLHMYADRLASQLSGGNQRKLSLAIALIGELSNFRYMRWLTWTHAGNPSVVLIDEFSTGIDAKMKRDMWGTLRNVAVGKAIVITTRTFSLKLFLRPNSNGYLDSMEEASALANKVGIISKQLLGKYIVCYYVCNISSPYSCRYNRRPDLALCHVPSAFLLSDTRGRD